MRGRLLAGLLTCAWPVAATEVYIGLESSKKAEPLTLGLAAFTPENPARSEDAAAAARLRGVLRDDLLSSRYFDIVEGAGGNQPKAAFLLAAKASHIADQITLTVSLKQESGESLLERYYRQKAEHWRSLAHKVADDVVRQLTGRPGIAHTQLAFVNDQGGNKEVYLADYDGERLRRLTSNGSINLVPRWRPDGKALAFTSYKAGNPDLYLLDLERGRTTVLSDRQGLNIAGGFSPDGSQLAATLSRGKNPNIHLLRTSDRSASAVTDHFGVDSSPTFSPDGQQLAFVSDRAGNPQVHVLEVATGRIRRLTRLNWCDSPAWSPTGEWIAFAGRASNKDRMDIFLVDVTGAKVVQLTHGQGSNEDPAWSPDGRFLAFTTTRLKRRQLYLMDADGSAPRLLVEAPGNSFTPSWGP